MGKPSTEGHQQSDVHCEDPHGPSTNAKLVGQHVVAANAGSQMHTPITKFLPSHNQQRYSEDYQQHHQAHPQQSSYSQGPQHHQLSEPFFKGGKNGAASGYIMHGGAADFGGQESMGTQHSTVGSHHQAAQFNQNQNQNLNTSTSSLGASKKSNLSMSGLRV
jgi:hypothetical protein